MHVLSRRWAQRFDEIEWPALILLHIVVRVMEEQAAADPFEGGSCWPEASLSAERFRVRNFDLGMVIWLGWDTDHTDIDLHVLEPSGEEVYVEIWLRQGLLVEIRQHPVSIEVPPRNSNVESCFCCCEIEIQHYAIAIF